MPKKRKGHRRLSIAVVVTTALAIWYVTDYLSSPAQGSLIKPQKSTVYEQAKSNTSKDAASNNLENDYFQLTVPKNIKIQAAQVVPSLLYSQTLIKPSDMGSQIINISLKTMPDGGLDGDSAYRLRQQQSARYSLSAISSKGETVQLFIDSQSSAVVAFWIHGAYLATISATSGVNSPAAEENNADQTAVLRTLLDAWQWR